MSETNIILRGAASGSLSDAVTDLSPEDDLITAKLSKQKNFLGLKLVGGSDTNMKAVLVRHLMSLFCCYRRCV